MVPDTYLNVVYTECRDCLNLILARPRWLQLIQGCKEVVKIIHSGQRHDGRPTLLSAERPDAESGYALQQSHPIYRLLMSLAVSKTSLHELLRFKPSVTGVMPISITRSRYVCVAASLDDVYCHSFELTHVATMDERRAYVFAW